MKTTTPNTLFPLLEYHESMDLSLPVPYHIHNGSFLLDEFLLLDNHAYDYPTMESAECVADCSDPRMEYIFNGLLIPIVASCGICGNILNLAIMSWRYNKREVNVLERGALLGLIALAVSDLCFCLGILPKFVHYESFSVFLSKGFRYYFQVYGIYFQNVFIKVSTWLTVIIATARYVVICHPLKARIFTGLVTTKVVIIVIYVTWFVLNLPLCWIHSLHKYDDGEAVVFVLDLGYFSINAGLNRCFTYLWGITGYFIPVVILTFCNINLVRALRRARKWRQTSAHHAPSERIANRRITSTLVALVLMYLVLVSPSELLHFYLETTHTASYNSVQIAIWSTNLLQAINFAFHFVVYCSVNHTFRRALTSSLCSMCRRPRSHLKHHELQYRRSTSMTAAHTTFTLRSLLGDKHHCVNTDLDNNFN